MSRTDQNIWAKDYNDIIILGFNGAAERYFSVGGKGAMFPTLCCHYESYTWFHTLVNLLWTDWPNYMRFNFWVNREYTHINVYFMLVSSIERGWNPL